jgi:Zn-dependent alcohol dehydrogenase
MSRAKYTSAWSTCVGPALGDAWGEAVGAGDELAVGVAGGVGLGAVAGLPQAPKRRAIAKVDAPTRRRIPRS